MSNAPAYSSTPALTLQHVNSALIPFLISRGDQYTASRIASCRHGPSPSHCRARDCTLCSRYRRIQHQRAALQQLSSALDSNAGDVPLFVTLTTTDCEPAELRERTKTIRQRWHKLFFSESNRQPLLGRKCTRAAGWIEVVPSSVSSDLYNAHIHAALAMGKGFPYTGRDRVRQADSSHLFDLWQTAAGSQARSADAQLVDNLEAVTKYAFKTSFDVIDCSGTVKQPAYVDPHTKQFLPAERVLFMNEQLSSLNRTLKHAWTN